MLLKSFLCKDLFVLVDNAGNQQRWYGSHQSVAIDPVDRQEHAKSPEPPCRPPEPTESGASNVLPT